MIRLVTIILWAITAVPVLIITTALILAIINH
jgi:hypothetical protein